MSGQPTADFIPCVAWDKLAEAIGNNLAKGRKVGVEGRIQVRSYDGNDGSKRYATEVVVNELEFLEPKTQGGQQNSQQGNWQNNNNPPELSDEEIPF